MRRSSTFEVLPGIWCVYHHPTKSCSYIVKTDPGAILIDAGPDPSGASIMMGLQQARVGLSSLRALVLTHWHFDQSAGAAALSKRSGTNVLYAEAEAPFLSGAREPSFWDRVRGRTAPAVAAERFVSDGAVIEGRLEVLETPGHTDGHLSFYLAEVRALIAGDALTVRSGQLRLTTENERARASALRCLNRDVGWVLPAHGSPLRDAVEIDAVRSRLG